MTRDTRTSARGVRRSDTPPPRTGVSERDVLTAFLNYLREGAVAKLDDVPETEARAAGVPSGTNLLGLVTHLTAVEASVFLGRKPRDWKQTFRAENDVSITDVQTSYRRAVAEANEVIAACTDLTHPVRAGMTGGSVPSMRWALVHMIEETGRHAGHLDILREQIDGRIGR